MFSISRALFARVYALTWQQIAALRAVFSRCFLKRLVLAAVVFFAGQSAVSVASPLTTDDTDMLGQGKWQFELSGEYSTFLTSRERVLTPELTYGVSDSVYVSINAPYQQLSPDAQASARGTNDPSISLKWRFYEKNGLSLAFAPSISLPLANEDKGLGNGRATYRAVGLMQYEAEDWTWLLNAGYIRNNNVAGDRRNLWSASAGVYYQVNPKTKVGLDYGYDSNTDPNITRLEHFAGLGVAYSPNEQFDFTLGYKRGFNQDSLDHSWLASVVVHW